MALGTLIEKLRNKKQAAHRSAFGHYLEMVRKLASGSEIDADQADRILSAADRDETALEKDVGIQSQRNTWAAQLQANRQAVQDRLQAERDFLAAQRKLETEIDRLTPAVQDAQNRMRMLDQIKLTTMQAESRLSEWVLNAELLEREAVVVAKLRPICDELAPLVKDRDFKRSSLANAEFNLSRLQARDEKTFAGSLTQWFSTPKDVRELAVRVDDLKSQIQQLDSAIVPRRQEQQRLQRELDSIHAEKLKP